VRAACEVVLLFPLLLKLGWARTAAAAAAAAQVALEPMCLRMCAAAWWLRVSCLLCADSCSSEIPDTHLHGLCLGHVCMAAVTVLSWSRMFLSLSLSLSLTLPAVMGRVLADEAAAVITVGGFTAFRCALHLLLSACDYCCSCSLLVAPAGCFQDCWFELPICVCCCQLHAVVSSCTACLFADQPGCVSSCMGALLYMTVSFWLYTECHTQHMRSGLQ